MTSETSVPISKLNIDRDAWPRFARSEERIELFAQLVASGEDLPPIEIVPIDSDRYLIADGVHRAHAALKAGRSEILAIVCSPESEETPSAYAFRRALETATKTALPLTTAERKAAAIRLATEQPSLSHRAIGRLVGASHDSVDRWLREQVEPAGNEAAVESEVRIITSNDVARQMARYVAKVQDARGISDHLAPSRMGKHLADALSAQFGDDALRSAQRLSGWFERAVDVLNAREL